jgi:hypothetical protein
MKDKEKNQRFSIVESDEDVVELYPSPDTVLKRFLGLNPMHILVISVDKDGTMLSSSNTASKAELLFMVEQFRHSLIAGEFDD